VSTLGQAEPIGTISVPMGRWGVASAPALLRTLLGSCAGVVLYDRSAKLGGVAHIVLPDSRGAADHPGKYADTAIPAMVADLERWPGRRGVLKVVAKVVGGASMFQTGPAMNIGQKNQDAVEQVLGRLGIPIVGRDVGGGSGRRLTLDTTTGVVSIRVPGGAEYDL
jgi:chemotaxis protein CheD